MKEAIITIAPDGSSATTEISGVKGAKCEDITKAFNNVLGQVTEDKKLPEYYLQEAAVVNVNGG